MTRDSWLVAAWDRFVAACAAFVGVLILLTMVLVTADVAGRYFFSKPIGWVFEVTEHILVFVPFLGMAYLVRLGAHVRIEIVVQALPQQWQRWAGVLANVLSAAACGIATWYAFATAIDHFARNIFTYGIYPVPKYLLIGVMAIGLAMTTIEFLRKVFEAPGASTGGA